MTLEDYALSYAHIGWKVLPLQPHEKRPATAHGLKDATNDPEQIKKWWKDNPNYNIGIATGEESMGLYIIDIDVDHEKGKDGVQMFKEWQKKHERISNTVTCKTPRGGYHLYFYDHNNLKNIAGIDGCIDTRANGGYIVAPPSIHPNGGTYTWIRSPSDKQVANLPRAWLDFISEYRKPKERAEEHPRKITQGNRTSTLVSKIGELSHTSIDKATIKATIQALNNTFEPPLTDEELEKEVFPALDRGWQEENEIPQLKTITANDLLQKEIPELKFLVKGICPAGLGILAAPPKYYKSFMALQLCVALSRGSNFLHLETTKTGCLYFDLESSNRRPQSRLKAMCVDNLDGVEFVTQEEIPRKNHKMITLATGFDVMLERYLDNNPSIGFVVIDVFKKIRTEQKKTQSLYEHDYADIEKLQAIAGKRNIAILMLHHTVKMKDLSDPFNNMSGSTGLLGAVDFAWIINKNSRNDRQATLSITGRDLENKDLTIEFDKAALQWRYIGTAEEIEAQKEMDDYDQHAITVAIRKLVEQGGGTWTGTTSDLIKASFYLQKPINQKPQQVGRYIQDNTHLLAIADNITADYQVIKNQRTYTFHKETNI